MIHFNTNTEDWQNVNTDLPVILCNTRTMSVRQHNALGMEHLEMEP